MVEEKEENKELIEKRERELEEVLKELASEARLTKDMADDLKSVIWHGEFWGYHEFVRKLDELAAKWMYEVEKPERYEYFRNVRKKLQLLPFIVKDIGAVRAERILDKVIVSLPE